jgi:mycothiol synthase
MNDWYERMEAMQETQHTVVVREPDGSMAGMTDVAWSAHTPTVVQQRFTGVRPDARGRGIGKWIKATMVERIRELHPEARWISTWNAASNDPMLAINHQLGFRRYRVGTEYQITRDELAARIGGDG